MWLAIVAPVISQTLASRQQGVDPQAAICSADALAQIVPSALSPRPCGGGKPRTSGPSHGRRRSFDACSYCGLLAHNVPLASAPPAALQRVERVTRLGRRAALRKSFTSSRSTPRLPRAPPVVSPEVRPYRPVLAVCRDYARRLSARGRTVCVHLFRISSMLKLLKRARQPSGCRAAVRSRALTFHRFTFHRHACLSLSLMAPAFVPAPRPPLQHQKPTPASRPIAATPMSMPSSLRRLLSPAPRVRWRVPARSEPSRHDRDRSPPTRRNTGTWSHPKTC